ncbi:MAG: hypothetical protein MOGMAGMI_01648 [Candidatus Omnitrophica bacterium]|nr:hypothetical protein [Candidatus Omnitrophota bacterium]
MHWSAQHTDNAARFLSDLDRSGYDFFTGVPCSLLGALLERLSGDGRYYPAVREDAAIGMASGAYLAGRRPVVLMQNSGLGYSLNVLTSLNLIYKIPVLCLITYRGQGPDAPEHWVMGRSCEALLRDIGIRASVPAPDGLAQALQEATRSMKETGEPYALLIQRGIFGA